jgi:two-component system phosphate regulon sensor histidine kinase PhoR
MVRKNPLRQRPMAKLDRTLQTLLDVLDEPAIAVAGGAIVAANQAAKELLGSGIEGGDIRLAIRSPKALSHILPGTPGDVEVTGIGGFGRPWLLSIRDFGQGRRLVRFIDRSATAAAEKIRVDFVANASHELRTPLSAILGYAETLADDDDLDREMRIRFGRTIRGEARRMLQIIEDLMDLSRIEADRFVAPTDEVSLVDVVTSAASQVESIGSGVDINVQVAGEIPAIIGDGAQLTQLADNLLSNAVRYGASANGGTISAKLERAEGSVILSVADSGPGIAAEHLPRLTERFYRADAARSRGSGGTGLGLAIVKHIVERHRGTLEIRSKVGKGTTVIVTLPIAVIKA